MNLLIVLCFLGADDSLTSCCHEGRCADAIVSELDTVPVNGTASNARSANFHVVSYSAKQDARQVAKLAEVWKTRLQNTWLEKEAKRDWDPYCRIVIHGNRSSYESVVGRAIGPSLGSTFIDYQKGKVLCRNVDLLLDNAGSPSALPHELTHVVLFEVFGGRQPPPWVDEGIAVLSDCIDKRDLHHQDATVALRSGRGFHCRELMTLQAYPTPDRVPAFYGESLSLVSFLSRRESSATFPAFVKTAMDHGYDHALREHYSIDGMGDLQRLWHQERQFQTAHNLSLPSLTSKLLAKAQ